MAFRRSTVRSRSTKESPDFAVHKQRDVATLAGLERTKSQILQLTVRNPRSWFALIGLIGALSTARQAFSVLHAVRSEFETRIVAMDRDLHAVLIGDHDRVLGFASDSGSATRRNHQRMLIAQALVPPIVLDYWEPPAGDRLRENQRCGTDAAFSCTALSPAVAHRISRVVVYATGAGPAVPPASARLVRTSGRASLFELR